MEGDFMYRYFLKWLSKHREKKWKKLFAKLDTLSDQQVWLIWKILFAIKGIDIDNIEEYVERRKDEGRKENVE